jgi:hypothetical protein
MESNKEAFDVGDLIVLLDKIETSLTAMHEGKAAPHELKHVALTQGEMALIIKALQVTSAIRMIVK